MDADFEGPAGNQLIVWHAEHIAEGGDGSPEFLWALKATQPGDRQVVWEGSSAGGIVGVVDFGEPGRRTSAGRYERWGVYTALDERIGTAALKAHPDLRARFTGNGRNALQGGPIWLSNPEAQALVSLASSWPTQRRPLEPPDGTEPEIDW